MLFPDTVALAVGGADEVFLVLRKVGSAALIHFAAALCTIQKPGEHTHFTHLGRTATRLANVLNNQEHAFLDDRRLGVLEDHPILRVIPDFLLALVGLLCGLEVYGMPQIVYEYDVQVPYTYYICTVKLENFNLSHVPVYIMSQDQLSLYAMYMATLGNRPDLFGGSEYIGKYYTADYEKYEIPPEALEDAQFAAIIKEAEKYLGYPYVWGGSSPSTSFDCSGFVSYVYNNCGVGWSFGRLGAEGLRQLCTRVSAANVRPGDLVFFQGTYDTTGASHVGIYVGNNMMLHCGDVRPDRTEVEVDERRAA